MVYADFMNRSAILIGLVLLSACGGRGQQPAPRPAETPVAVTRPRTSSVEDLIRARRAAVMTAKLRGQPQPHLGGRGNLETAKMTGAAPRMIIPGVDDQ